MKRDALPGPDSAHQAQAAEVRAADPGDPSSHGVLEKWNKNPRAMWDWRVDTFRRTLIELENHAFNPGSRDRKADTLKALELLQKYSERLDDVKEDMETACPKCKHRFKPGA